MTEPETVVCRECGHSERANYLEPTRSRMTAQSLCFTCLFWTDLVAVRDSLNIARIEGLHYQIGPEDNTPKDLRGHAGARSVIRFFDGREVTTTNLWYQGAIPAPFVDRLPDNAAFIERS